MLSASLGVSLFTFPQGNFQDQICVAVIFSIVTFAFALLGVALFRLLSRQQEKTLNCFKLQTSSSTRPPSFVLVKCCLATKWDCPTELLILTIPVYDLLATIGELKVQVTAKVLHHLHDTGGGLAQVCWYNLYWSSIKCSIEQQLAYYLPLPQPLVFYAQIRYTLPSKQLRFEVKVKMIVGKIMSFQVTQDCTVGDLKTQIRDNEGVPPDQQRLIFAGKQLEDHMCLEDYDIRDNSVLHLVLRLGCGGFKFADFTDCRIIRMTGYKDSDKSNNNRCMAVPGLCVEGNCENPRCSDHGYRAIALGPHMGVFDPVVNAHLFVCRMCRKVIKPETIAFNECEWRYLGIKVNPAPEEVLRSLDWKLVETDMYERFSSARFNIEDWSRLLIYTRPSHRSGTSQLVPGSVMEGVCTECRICFVEFKGLASDPEMVTHCGHKYHASCLKVWRNTGHITCPQCAMFL